MGVESLQTISTILFIVAGIVFLISIIIFFALEIPKAFGLVTGISASRGIKKLQKQNIESSGQSSRTSGTSPVSTRPMQNDSPQTSKIATTNLYQEKEENVHSIAETTVLSPEPALPIENPNAVFMVIQELSFASSTEIIE